MILFDSFWILLFNKKDSKVINEYNIEIESKENSEIGNVLKNVREVWRKRSTRCDYVVY